MDIGGLGLQITGRRMANNEIKMGKSRSDAKIILFDVSKGEICTPAREFKAFKRKIAKDFLVRVNKDDITVEILEGVRVLVLGAPTESFEKDEISALKEFVSSGGSVLAMGAEGGEKNPNVAISTLTQEFGITINNDAVVRTAYRKDYFHPKEVYIAGASLTAEVDAYSGKKSKSDQGQFDLSDDSDEEESGGRLTIVYPFGATLSIERPAVPLISSGKMSFPANRALVAMAKLNGGVLIALGSALPFTDKYINKEDNASLLQGCIEMLTIPEVKTGAVDSDRPEFKAAVQVPDTEALAERLRCCLQETEDLPADFTKMFEHKLYDYNTDLVPDAVTLYERLNVKHEPLSLIPPQFEVPLPPLQPAVFLPCMRELPPPALDLFDLDQEFSDNKAQLAQITNKCKSLADLDYYVQQAGQILDVTPLVAAQKTGNLGGADTKGDSKKNKGVMSNGASVGEVSAKEVLEYVFKKLVNYKKIDADAAGPAGVGSAGMEQENRESSAKLFASACREGVDTGANVGFRSRR